MHDAGTKQTPEKHVGVQHPVLGQDGTAVQTPAEQEELELQQVDLSVQAFPSDTHGT